MRRPGDRDNYSGDMPMLCSTFPRSYMTNPLEQFNALGGLLQNRSGGFQALPLSADQRFRREVLTCYCAV